MIPTLGSKEAIFSFANVVLDLAGGRDTVVLTEPGYPVGVRGAQFAGARVVELPLLEEHGFLPDLDAVPAETWQRTALCWVNYPNNPTGATAPLAFYERLAALAREHDFVLASDEAYTRALVRRAARLGAPARRLDEPRGRSTRSRSARR